MLLHLFVGALAMMGLFLLVNYVRKSGMRLTWWHWILTILGLLYAVFVLEVIAGFITEGAPQAALVMGMITGMVAIIWGVLLRRFVFKKA